MSIDPIEVAIAAIDSQELGESFSYNKIAKQFGVVRSTLIRRHQRVTQARTIANTSRRLLNPQQELEQHNARLTEQGTPPTRLTKQQSASQLAGRPVSMVWVDRFIRRDSDSLLPRWVAGIDRNRHNVDSGVKYNAYFNLLHGKIAEYGVEPRHIYNMDEKGFLLGITGRSKRIFDRALYESHRVPVYTKNKRKWYDMTRHSI